jgi:hypothetical protein
MPGLYNTECGIIINPAAAQVLCSYYADFTSWTDGCAKAEIGDGWRRMSRFPSRPQDSVYAPGQLKDMMEMSQELQAPILLNVTATAEAAAIARRVSKSLRQKGNGEPEGHTFWNGQYNEVLISSSIYRRWLPQSVAGIFYVEGGDEDGPECAKKTLSGLVDAYGKDADHVKLLIHSPGASPGFKLPPSSSADAVARDNGSTMALDCSTMTDRQAQTPPGWCRDSNGEEMACTDTYITFKGTQYRCVFDNGSCQSETEPFECKSPANTAAKTNGS